MNIWKTSTILLAGALSFLAARDAFHSAVAATGSNPSDGKVGWEWGMEQPRMERALADLRGARHSLEAASEHHGGWRALALKHTDEAIAETVRGIEYGKAHPRE